MGMINSLQCDFDDSAFSGALRSGGYWRDNEPFHELICGNYIAAAVWKVSDEQAAVYGGVPWTWRTGRCGAHNSAMTKEEAMQRCEEYLQVNVNKHGEEPESAN